MYNFCRKSEDWWVRRKEREYFNSANLDAKQTTEFLTAAGIPLVIFFLFINTKIFIFDFWLKF